jgi:hypothetical protein
MTREEVKQIVLRQCAREKKIVLRNIIVVALLVKIVLALLWIYGLPSLILYNQQAIAASNPTTLKLNHTLWKK